MDEPEPELDEAALARWQARLLGLLREGWSPEAIRAALAADPELAVCKEYAEALDLHALVVATQLVARWRPDKGPRDPGV